MEGERIVTWEKFLPRRSLRVLVVEGDDSSRQIVSALLRNCSYQVTAVGDGLLAWGLLEDPSNCFDLVLTEVAMISLSGFNLLCKITSHESLKHIPVIMMSSFDSMSVVFKCLTNGAADFLVKPVRKNELQNLWQHVWRRCHNSSCSSSGRQNQNAAQRKNEAGYGNNAGSIGGSENASSGLDIKEGSDNGSSTQGSWTNQHEVGSSHQRGKWKQLGCHGSKFDESQQIKKEKIQNNWMHSVATSLKACRKDIRDDVIGQDLVIPVAGRVSTHVECLKEETIFHNQPRQNKEVDCSASCGECGRLGSESVKEGSEPSIKAIDLIGNMGSEPNCRNGDQDGRREEGKIETEVNCCHGKHKFHNCMPELELTLNHLQGNWNEYSKLKGKCTLRQSDASAFSRYNTGGTHFPFPWTGSFPVNLYPKNTEQYCLSSENMGSLHLKVPFEQLGCSKQSGGDAADQYQLSQNTNNQDRGYSIIGSSGQAARLSSVPMKDETPVSLPMGVAMPIPRGIISFDGIPPPHDTYLHPMFHSYPGVPIWDTDTGLKAEREDACDSYYHEPHCVSLRDHSHHYSNLHHHHIQYHHHHHHHHHDEGHEHKKHARQVECAVDNSATTDQDGSYIMLRNTVDSNCGEVGSSNGHGSNGNADRSVSASNNNGINVLTGKSSGAVISGANGAGGTSNTLTSTTSSGVENNRSTHRETALMKFRQKRKERCFEKKVQYQSRKMFAEQRPRVKGQFVRHMSINKSEAGKDK